MQRRQQRAIWSFRRIFRRQRNNVPDRQAIRQYFRNLPIAQQIRLQKTTLAEEKPTNPTISVIHQAQQFPENVSFGLSSIATGYRVKMVVHFEGNFTICQGSYNIRNRDGGQNSLQRIIVNGDINNIRIHRRQARDLLKLLNGIRKRYLDLFVQRCRLFGVPNNVTQQIKYFLEMIHRETLRVIASMDRNNGEESDSESQEDSQEFSQYVPEDQSQSQFEASQSILDSYSVQRQYDRDDPSYPGSCDGRSSC